MQLQRPARPDLKARGMGLEGYSLYHAQPRPCQPAVALNDVGRTAILCRSANRTAQGLRPKDPLDRPEQKVGGDFFTVPGDRRGRRRPQPRVQKRKAQRDKTLDQAQRDGALDGRIRAGHDRLQRLVQARCK